MSEDDPNQGAYDITPPEPKPTGPKPGDADWVPPTPIIEKADPVEEEVPLDPDIEKHRGIAILGYFFFAIPLIAAPHSKFARFHANQSLLLFILWAVGIAAIVIIELVWAVIGSSLQQHIYILWAFFGCIAYLLPVALLVFPLVLTVMGIVHAANGEKKVLPLLGHWTLIKQEG